MEILVDILKVILKTFVIFFAILGLKFLIFVADYITNNIKYYQNDSKIDAIEYHNEIYLKKGE